MIEFVVALLTITCIGLSFRSYDDANRTSPGDELREDASAGRQLDSQL